MPQAHEEKPQEDWMAKRWRPAMGWLYMAVCAFDFIIAPILWSMTQAYYHIVPFVQWQPLTLQGAGLFHLAMGAVLGIAAYGRTKEKMAGAENGGLHTEPDLSQGFGPGVGTTYTPPGGGFNNGLQGMGSTPAYGAPSTGFGGMPQAITPAPAFGSPSPACPTTGKPLGPALSFPAI
jgi:hypothetical protein